MRKRRTMIPLALSMLAGLPLLLIGTTAVTARCVSRPDHHRVHHRPHR